MLRKWVRSVVCGAGLFSSIAGAASFRFAVVGDRTGRAVPGIYEQTWREIAAWKPDFAITVGDAIEGLDDARAKSEWESLQKVWAPGLRTYHTPGNHDIWNVFSEHLFTQMTGFKPRYSFDFQQAHFVVLDNSRTEDLGRDQIDFLRADLERNHGKTPIFVFFHRAYWLLPLKLGIKGFDLQKIATDYGVCCIVSGHGHQFQNVESGGVLYLEVGSSGASLERAGAAGIGFSDGWFYQYAAVSVERTAVHIEIRELGPPHGSSRVITVKSGASEPGSSLPDKHHGSLPKSREQADPQAR